MVSLVSRGKSKVKLLPVSRWVIKFPGAKIHERVQQRFHDSRTHPPKKSAEYLVGPCHSKIGIFWLRFIYFEIICFDKMHFFIDNFSVFYTAVNFELTFISSTEFKSVISPRSKFWGKHILNFCNHQKNVSVLPSNFDWIFYKYQAIKNQSHIWILQ